MPEESEKIKALWKKGKTVETISKETSLSQSFNSRTIAALKANATRKKGEEKRSTPALLAHKTRKKNFEANKA